jgi:hypothetical protein
MNETMEDEIESDNGTEVEEDDEETEEHDIVDDENETDKTEKHLEFSKNSIISISRKSGIKCISQCGIEKIKTLLHDKINTMSSQLSAFYTGNSKTLTKQMMIDFLEMKNIHVTN